MRSDLKKSPALTDTDPMPFGKFRGTLMQDVPPSYLRWLKHEGCSNELVSNYIHNSWDAIELELGDKD